MQNDNSNTIDSGDISGIGSGGGRTGIDGDIEMTGYRTPPVLPGRQYKDRLFKAIFGREEHKPYLLSLYNALNGTSYTNPDDLELTTIENIIYITMKNDVSFLLDSQMNLYEQQVLDIHSVIRSFAEQNCKAQYICIRMNKPFFTAP